MNKGELVEAMALERTAEGIAQKTNVSKKETDAILTAIVDEIMAEVADGNKVTLVGFGTFEPRDRSSREGRNPRTGETMTIAATRVSGFSAVNRLKTRLLRLHKSETAKLI